MNPNREKEILEIVEQTISAGPYKAEWGSLMNARLPEWFKERRLGIFTHWGPYSVGRYHDWYARNMYIKDSPEYEYHLKHFGPHTQVGLKDLIPRLSGEKFDPAEWISLFKEAGAGYIFPVAEHHDGFQMYNSDLSDWNAVKMGPKRDVLGELKAEAEKQDIVFCTSSHRAEHWWFLGHGKEFDSDIKDPLVKGDIYWPSMPEPDNWALQSQPYPTEEYLNDWLARTAEIILKYQPKLLYFDWWIQHQAFKPYLKKLAAFYYNCGKQWGTDVLICYKHDALMFGSGIVEVERGSLSDAKPYPWQTDTAVGRNGWSCSDFLEYKSSFEIVCTLVDVVSKGGNLLLNVGPNADGSIPEGDKKILQDLAAWMKVNGEAINGSKCWSTCQEGPTKIVEGCFAEQSADAYSCHDYRFTVNNGAIYAICMRCPEDGKFTVKSLKDNLVQNSPGFHGLIEKVEILGYNGPVTWEKDAEGLHVRADVRSGMPVVLKITAE